MPSTAFESLVAMLRARPKDKDSTVEQTRERFERMTPLLGPPPDGVAFAPGTLARFGAERYSPDGAPGDAIVLFLHGGGYCIGSLNTHRTFAARLALAARVTLVNFEYRLAPENPFPAALDDAVAAYRALVREGYDPARIVICGDSAGGGLALATLAVLRDSGERLPAAAVCLSPWTDLANTGASIDSRASGDPVLEPWELRAFSRYYMNGSSPRNSLASPLYGSFAGFPPLLIHVGDAEILRDDSTRAAQRARDAGVDVTFKLEPEMIHVWHFFAPLIPEGAQAIDEVGAFVRRHLGT